MTGWSKASDRELLKLRKQGLSFSTIGAALGVSRGACIGRYHRLKGMIFPCDLREQERARNARTQKAAKQDAAIAEMAAAMCMGASKKKAVTLALRKGATLSAVGRHFGISKQAVHQMVSR